VAIKIIFGMLPVRRFLFWGVVRLVARGFLLAAGLSRLFSRRAEGSA
jgi:hypothetical protein